MGWEPHVWEGSWNEGIDSLLSSTDFCVLGRFLPRVLKEKLLQSLLHAPLAAVLICTSARPSVARVLIVNRGRDNGSGFLDSVIELRDVMQVPPVVLTVAGSLGEAQEAQEVAEEAFAAHHLPANFDFMVDRDAAGAIRWESQLRTCSHLIVEKAETPAWPSWRHSDRFHRLLSLTDGLSVLALPCLVRLDTVLSSV